MLIQECEYQCKGLSISDNYIRNMSNDTGSLLDLMKNYNIIYKSNIVYQSQTINIQPKEEVK